MPSTDTEWSKSTHSGQNGECLEVRRTAVGLDVRDSKEPYGPILSIPADAWSGFLAAVAAGDHP
ncbi:DUF397 domain-containing protein [Streptomyces sp. N2-109]|uniref:DUF397 domain-containing protein n=1 Tax=Streptomyces gossypii TaxID=2883101 RepID=A0ABT2K171_9ACTN|nr:DUF397 domain-containing protein [Streptomyces gossypii]MCT2593917.1 DUF397 domain-containing protein [Streptomyces gossypii]